MADSIIWQGDLEDDCFARWGDMTAHVEKMDEDEWYCSVTLYRTEAGREDIFHSSDDDILPLSGKAARRLCELVMRAHKNGFSWR